MANNTALITGFYGGLGTCFVNIHAGKGGDPILVAEVWKNRKDRQRKSQINIMSQFTPSRQTFLPRMQRR